MGSLFLTISDLATWRPCFVFVCTVNKPFIYILLAELAHCHCFTCVSYVYRYHPVMKYVQRNEAEIYSSSKFLLYTSQSQSAMVAP